MMLSVYHTLFQHYALMFLQELQFTGGKRCFCSYLALRDSVGQIAHHEGAIAMAETELKYGKDPKMRKLAQDIIKAQKGEIEQMNKWLDSQK